VPKKNLDERKLWVTLSELIKKFEKCQSLVKVFVENIPAGYVSMLFTNTQTTSDNGSEIILIPYELCFCQLPQAYSDLLMWLGM
jgi:hypothetical protein